MKRFFGSRLFLIVLFIIAVLVALGYARAYYQDYKVKQEIKSLQNDVKNLEKKKLESMEILKYVTSDAFVEEKARTELNLKKPGENVLIMKSEEQEDLVLAKNQAVEEKDLSNPMKWWYYFTQR